MVALALHARLTAEQTFRDRVKAAAVQAALQISGESAGAVIPFKSQLRQNFAGLILSDQVDVGGIVWAVAANGTILDSYGSGGAAGVSDSDIEYVLTTVWDDLCGAARQPDEAP